MPIEYIDICDEKGNLLGYSLPRSEVLKKGLYFKIVKVYIIDSNGNVLIQKRSKTKEVFPSLWDSSVSGHIQTGMTAKETAIKEVEEELGLCFSTNSLEYLYTFNKKWDLTYNNIKINHNNVVENYLITLKSPFDLSKLSFQDKEVEKVKIITCAQLKDIIYSNDKSFIPHCDPGVKFDDSPYVTLFKILEERYPKKQQQIKNIIKNK